MAVSAPAGTPLFTLRDAVSAEGKFIRQSGCPSKYGHVFLRIEPKPEDAGLRLEWLVPEDVIPKDFLSGSFDGLATAAERTELAGGGRIAGVRMVITGGSWHETDSNDMAFHVAAAIAFQQAVENAALVPLRVTT